MGIETALIAAAAVGGVSTAYQMYSGNKAEQQQRSAQRQAQRQAEATAQAADEANNKVNQKRPDVAGALASAMQAGKSGASGTMLTGPGGVDPGALSLGKSTLLGG